MLRQTLHLTTNAGFKKKRLQLEFTKHLEYHKQIIKMSQSLLLFVTVDIC